MKTEANNIFCSLVRYPPHLLRSDSATTRIRAVKEVKPKFELVDFEYFPQECRRNIVLYLNENTEREDDYERILHVLQMWQNFKDENPTMGNEEFIYQRVHISLPMAFLFRGDYALNQLQVRFDSVRLKVSDYYIMVFKP